MMKHSCYRAAIGAVDPYSTSTARHLSPCVFMGGMDDDSIQQSECFTVTFINAKLETKANGVRHNLNAHLFKSFIRHMPMVVDTPNAA